MASDIEHSFYMSMAICMFSFKKYLFRSFVHFLIGLLFPGVESYKFFIYFGGQTFVLCIIGKYVLPYGRFPFHLMMVSLAMQKPFNLI